MTHRFACRPCLGPRPQASVIRSLNGANLLQPFGFRSKQIQFLWYCITDTHRWFTPDWNSISNKYLAHFVQRIEGKTFQSEACWLHLAFTKNNIHIICIYKNRLFFTINRLLKFCKTVLEVCFNITRVNFKLWFDYFSKGCTYPSCHSTSWHRCSLALL